MLNLNTGPSHLKANYWEPQFNYKSFINGSILHENVIMDHFTVACLVACPLNESEAGGDLVLIETSLLFLC